MHILIVTDAYPPEVRSSSNLMLELAQGLRDRGHHVTVLTGWPQYNLDKAAALRTFAESTDESGIHVIRVKTLPHHNVNFVLRGIAQLLLPFHFLRALRRHASNSINGVVVYSPPLPLAFVGAHLRRRGARYILNMQDIFPQNAVDLGVLSNSAIIAFFRWMERRAYRDADIVTAHSEGNRTHQITAHPSLDSKLRVLHNWVDIEQFGPSLQSLRDFRSEWNLHQRFVVLFAGILGPSQNLEIVLDVAARVQDLSDLLFLFVGDGSSKSTLEERSRQEGLANVEFRPFVSREEYPALVKAADVGLVTLSVRNKTPVVPSKILSYMAGRLPIAAFLDRESDAHKMVQDARCGYTCVSNSPEEMESILRRLYRERQYAPQLGANGLAYVQENFAKDKVLDQMAAWLME